MSVHAAPFGELKDGRKAELFTLTSKSGFTACVTNYGGRITSIKTAGLSDELGEVTLGYDSLAPYLEDPYFLGAMIGRYASRIGGAQFTLDGETFHLTANESPNHLHGGDGFHYKLWTAELDKDAVILSYFSPHGENGYPGDMSVDIRLYWETPSTLRIDFHATCTQPCPINLTNHAYFNLGGTNVLGHQVIINADKMSPVNSHGIPTGNIISVENSPFDLQHSGAYLGPHMKRWDIPEGFDHNYSVPNQEPVQSAAHAYTQSGGRTLNVFTTQPGLQFYTGLHLKGGLSRDGGVMPAFAGMCFEGQHFPDSPNQATFPNTILRPGETYSESICYSFGAFK